MALGVFTPLLRRLLLAPASMMTALMLVLVPALLEGLAPFPIGATRGAPARLIYDLAFLDATLLSACALHGCIGLSWATRQLTHGARLALEGSLLVSSAALLTALTLALQALSSPRLCDSPLRSSLTVLAPICHLAALGLLLLRLDLSATVGPWVLLSIAWLLPALFDLPLCLGPVPRAPGPVDVSWAPSPRDIAPILGWFLAAVLLERQRPVRS